MKKYKEKRPWGGFEQFTINEKSTVKILTLLPRQKFSLQYHKKRKEFWLIKRLLIRKVLVGELFKPYGLLINVKD